MTFSFRWLIAAFTLGVLCCLGVHLWMRPPVTPLTDTEKKQLEDGGFVEVHEGPIADKTPDLPGTPAVEVHATMPRRHRPSGPGARLTPPGSRLPPDPEPPGPIYTDHQTVTAVAPPIETGLTADDLSGHAEMSMRAAGGQLWSTTTLTCCAGEVCRTDPQAETLAGWDRAALCGTPRKARLWTVSAGVAIPSPEIVAGLAYYGEGKRMGYYGSLRYSLDPAATDTVQPTGEFGYRTVSDTAAKLRVEAGLTWRFGR